MTDVFISYAREDRPFVQRLHDALATEGRESWVDWEGIPASAKWMAEVRAAIDEADCFCFVVSPDSVESPVCREEAAHAAASNKRILPLLHREVPDGLVPETVAAHNWISFDDGESFEQAFAILVSALETEPEHLRTHTRVLVRAKEWESSTGNRSFLLRGQDLTQAENWLSSAQGKEPAPTQLHTSYVLASRKAASRRQRTTVGAVAIALVLSLVLSAVAVIQRGEAQDAQARAEEQTVLAEERAAESRSRELSVRAGAELSRDPELSLILAVEAFRSAETSEAKGALADAVVASNVRVTMPGHASTYIAAAAFSPDGRLVFSDDGTTVRTWDAATGDLLSEVEGDTAVAFNPDSQLVTVDDAQVARVLDPVTGAPASAGQTATLWSPTSILSADGTRLLGSGELLDAATGAIVVRLQEAGEEADGSFSPDGDLVASVASAGIATVSRTTDGRTLLSFDHGGLVSDIQFSPDGDLVATVGQGPARLWDVGTGEQVAQIESHSDYIGSLAFSPDGTLLATGGDESDRTVRITELRTGELVGVLRGHDSAVTALAFSSDGRLLASASDDHTARIWDVASGSLERFLLGHGAAIRSIAFSPDGRSVVTASSDGTVRIWDATGGRTVADIRGILLEALDYIHRGEDSAEVIRPVGDTAVVTDARTGDDVMTLSGHDGDVLDAAFNGSGTLAVTGGSDGTARVWDVTSGDEVSSLSRHDGAVVDASFGSDDQRVLTSDGSSTARLWEVGSGRLIAELPQAPGSIASFIPDGHLVLGVSADIHLRAWDAATGDPVADFGEFPDYLTVGRPVPSSDGSTVLFGARTSERTSVIRVGSLSSGDSFPLAKLVSPGQYALSHDGALIAQARLHSSGFANAFAVWGAGTGERLATMEHEDQPISSSFSPDDGLLATTGFDNVVRLWRTSDWSPVGVLRGHTGAVVRADFSPSGEYLVSASEDGTVRLWEVASGRQLMVLRGRGWASMASDELILAYGSGGFELYRCDVCISPEELFELAESRVTRELTPEERGLYLHE